jgi:hypothetical protein
MAEAVMTGLFAVHCILLASYRVFPTANDASAAAGLEGAQSINSENNFICLPYLIWVKESIPTL